MSIVDDTIARLRSAIVTLEGSRRFSAVAPEAGHFYMTLNDSVVYALATNDQGVAKMVVLSGGHGVRGTYGEKPGEEYRVGSDGYCLLGGVELIMSLREKLDISLVKVSVESA